MRDGYICERRVGRFWRRWEPLTSPRGTPILFDSEFDAWKAASYRYPHDVCETEHGGETLIRVRVMSFLEYYQLVTAV